METMKNIHSISYYFFFGMVEKVALGLTLKML